MPIVKEFKGTHYNPKVIQDLSAVTAPPYDMINEKLKEELKNRNQYNIVRLTLPDGNNNEKYKNAKKNLLSWLLRDILTTDKEPGIYLYEQVFTHRGVKYKKRGFFAIMKLEEFGESVLPHEKTFSGPKEDRFKLMEEVEGDLEPVYFMYEDPNNIITEILKPLEFDYTVLVAYDLDGFKHSVWKLPNEKIVEKIKEFMKGSKIIIADGHHRYETALNYAKMRREKEPSAGEEAPWNYVFGAFFNIYDPANIILPTHRLLKLETFMYKDFMQKLGDFFKLSVVNFSGTSKLTAVPKFLEFMERKRKEGAYVFGLFSAFEPEKIYLLQLKPEINIDELLKDIPEPLRRLETVLLEEIVLKRVIGLSEEEIRDISILGYVRGEEEAIRLVENGTRDMTFLLNPTKIEDVVKVTKSKLFMPPKSTDFYPKLLSGLLMYLFGEQNR